MNTFKLTVSTPNGNVFKGDAVKLNLRGASGDLAVMAGHIPFITTVKEGEFSVDLPEGERKSGNIGGGLLTVSKDAVILLSGSVKFDK
ncbi:MAG: F0F1 ATP synthase subunit epsilon [Clostridia bacterium]|nr:F0F1 ATP synthase subunit epsilon [Clostridia bacterium]